EDKGLSVLVTAESAVPSLDGFPKRAQADILPPDRQAAVRSFLDHWAPDVLVLAGSDLPPTLIVQAYERGVPLLLVDAAVSARLTPGAWLRKGMTASLLGRFARLLVQDPDSAGGLRGRG
ncbi:MAG: 3-deoxy-D-manno-octulosonic acid transferase, partial [Rhodobacteraceae bacterium]|nr:3-deoxy-D-manno-octulosonic acid transferase [Paracoccaceae bacterium]